VFFWPRVRRRWRPLLGAYALAMAFSLVYSAEHYVFDILLGWLLTGLVCAGFTRWEARRAFEGAGPASADNLVGLPDTLDGPLAASL
jgi:membrane-associated phospholipid phosphatase